MQPKITRVLQTTASDDQGRPVAIIHIDFMVGAHGPFSVQLPKSQFTAAAANQKIQEFVQHLSGLQGLQ